MSRAFDCAKEITIAALGSMDISSFVVDADAGACTAEFFEAVYNKIKEIEDKEISEQDF